MANLQGNALMVGGPPTSIASILFKARKNIGLAF